MNPPVVKTKAPTRKRAVIHYRKVRFTGLEGSVDLDGIKNLLRNHGHLFDPAYTPDAIDTEIKQIERYGTAVVAEHRGKIVGFSRYGHTPYRIEDLRKLGLADEGQERHGYIFSLLIHPNYKRRGIGTRLVQRGIDEIRKMRYEDGSPVNEVVMTCHEANKGTQVIARKLEFEEAGRVEAQGRKKHKATLILHTPLIHE